MSKDNERIEETNNDESAEAVLPLQETPAEESSDVEAHFSSASVSACMSQDA